MRRRAIPFPKFGTGIGLHRVGDIAQRLGLDLDAFGARAAAITGSNGKGSTAAMLAEMLRGDGARVGRFTSPHLFSLNERFWLEGEDISDAELDHHWARVEGAATAWLKGRDEQIGGFEFLFLIAADWFAARGCDYTVWEAGLGGRYDPVRLARATTAALTSLDFEHTQLLGESLELIAYEKLDIAPAGAAMYVAETCANLRDQIQSYCHLRCMAVEFVAARELGALVPPLPGAHQRANAALALRMARRLRPALAEYEAAAALARTRWPGRLEIIETDPLIAIDVGHTPAAIAAARAGFEALRQDRRATLVCGASIDKDAGAIVAALAPGFSTIICAAARHKGRPAAEIAALARAAAPEADIVLAENIAEARNLALGHGQKNSTGRAVYVAGGLFLAAEFKAAHLGLDPALLAFF